MGWEEIPTSFCTECGEKIDIPAIIPCPACSGQSRATAEYNIWAKGKSLAEIDCLTRIAPLLLIALKREREAQELRRGWDVEKFREVNTDAYWLTRMVLDLYARLEKEMQWTTKVEEAEATRDE